MNFDEKTIIIYYVIDLNGRTDIYFEEQRRFELPY